ncbi:hypothetical protein MRX96_042261 [Rhipicephalus microplus]
MPAVVNNSAEPKKKGDKHNGEKLRDGVFEKARSQHKESGTTERSGCDSESSASREVGKSNATMIMILIRGAISGVSVEEMALKIGSPLILCTLGRAEAINGAPE